jgi:E3 ubiquitin-protein ligase TRIP12
VRAQALQVVVVPEEAVEAEVGQVCLWRGAAAVATSAAAVVVVVAAVVGRLPRQKLRVSRSSILEAAQKIVAEFSSTGTHLEIEFSGEVGTGLGPTLEFFSLVCDEIRRDALRVWRPEVPGAGSCAAPDSSPASAPRGAKITGSGMFPRPLRASGLPTSTVKAHFTFLGKFMARGLLDGRLLDLPLSPLFFRLALGIREGARSPRRTTNLLRDLAEIDPDLSKSLSSLLTMAPNDVASLCLDFTCPGEPAVSLSEAHDDVNGSNVTR